MDETLTSCNRIILPEKMDTNPCQQSSQELSISAKLKDSMSQVDIETGNEDLVPSSGGTSAGTRTALRNRVRPAFVQPLDVIVEVPSERNSSASSSRITNEMEKLSESHSVERSQNMSDENRETRTNGSLEKTGEGNQLCSGNSDVQPGVNLPQPVLDDTIPRPVVRKFVKQKDDLQSSKVTSQSMAPSSSESSLNLQTPLNEPLFYSNGLYFKHNPEFYSLKVDNSRTWTNRTAEYTQELAVAGEGCSSVTRPNYGPRDLTVERTTDFRSLMLSSSSYITPCAQPSKQRDKPVEQLRLEESQKPSRASVEQELILNKIKVMAANGELGTKFRNATNSASNQINCKDASIQKHSEMLPRDKRKRNKENVDPKLVRNRQAVNVVPVTNSNRNDPSVENSERNISWKSPRKTPKRSSASSGLNSERHRLSTTSVILSPENALNTGVTISLNEAEPAGDKILPQPGAVNADDDAMSFSSVQTNFSEMFIGLPSKLLRDSHTVNRAGAFQVLAFEGGQTREGVGCDRGISPGTELERLSNGPVSDSFGEHVASPFEGADNYEKTVCPVAQKQNHPTDAVGSLSGLNKDSFFSGSSAAQDRQKMHAFRTTVVQGATPCTTSSEWNRANQPPSSVRINTHNTVHESVLTVNDKLPTTGTTAAAYVNVKQSSTSNHANKFKSNTSKAEGAKSIPAVNITNSALVAGDAMSAQSAVLVSNGAPIHIPTTQPDTTSAPSTSSIQVSTSLQSTVTLPSAILETVGQSMASSVLPHPSKKQSKDKSCQNFAIGRFLSAENQSTHDLSDSSKHLPQNTQTLPHSSKDQTTIDLSSLSGQSSSQTPLTSGISFSNLSSKHVAGPQFDTGMFFLKICYYYV